MKKNYKKIFLVTILTAVFAVGFFLEAGNAQAAHPSLVVTADQYPELRARAGTSSNPIPPWSTMKNDAILKCNSIVFNNNDNDINMAETIERIVNNCALAYILDPGNAAAYKTKFMNTVANMGILLTSANFLNDHTLNKTKVAAPLIVNGVMTLDIFYPDLDAGQRTAYQTRLSDFLQYNTYDSFAYASKAVWYLYLGDYINANYWLNKYIQFRWNGDESTDAGVFTSGPMYGWGGNSSYEGPAKSYAMDVMALSGLFDFYRSTQVETNYEWLFHMGTNPIHTNNPIGDTRLSIWDITHGNESSARLWTLARWSEELAGHGFWLNSSHTIPDDNNSLLSYILLKTVPAPLKPTSKIFPDGGAGFWEKNASSESLMATLLTLTDSGSHSRKEANAVTMVGYGEHLLIGPGYPAGGTTEGCTDAGGTVWPVSWFRYNAESSNTVKIGSLNHNGTSEVNIVPVAGITEGFIGTYLDYASGDSGNALNGGHHQRNFMMVHPQTGKNNGYFILFDEISATAPTYAETYFHPNADGNGSNPMETLKDTEYSFYMDPNTQTAGRTSTYAGYEKQLTPSANGERLAIFYGTAPNTGGVTLATGAVGRSTQNGCWLAKYAKSRYATDSAGKKNIVTVLFPYDPTHAKANFTRISGVNYSGAEISHSLIVKDYAIESSSANPVNYNGVTFQGLASLFRKNNGSNEFYFVRKGKEFNDGQASMKGFSSNNVVSVYLNEKKGIIISSGSQTTFYYPNINSIKLDNALQANVSSGSGMVTVNIPSGTHTIELVNSGDTVPPADVNQDGNINIQDIQICVKVITGQTTNPRADVNGDGAKNIKDIQAIVRAIIGG